MAVAWAWARHVKRLRMPLRRSAKRVHPMRAFFCKTTAADFFSGLCLFPLYGLAVSVFSDPLLQELAVGQPHDPERGRSDCAVFDVGEFLTKRRGKLCGRRNEEEGGGQKGKAQIENAQTKKACRFGKPLVLFDVSVATWLRG